MARVLPDQLESVEEVPGLFGVWSLRHHLLEALPWRDDELRAIAERIPASWLNAYDSDGADLPNRLTPVRALARLNTVTGVVRLMHLELVPEYRAVMDGVTRSMASIATPGQVVTRHTGVVYVANQGSRARLHVDRHPNFFVHLAGRKRFTVAGCSDSRRHQALITSYLSGRGGEGIEADVTRTFDLDPGDALYLPPLTIHGVETPASRSVSVACSWSTPSSERLGSVLWANAQLRRVGIRPISTHRHNRSDPVKLALARVVSRLGWARPPR
jgi:hypothetical protein